MFARVPESPLDQSGSTDQTGAALTDQMVSDDDGWFTDIARSLFPKDAGFAMHLITGFEERTCYRYAAGHRKPPGYFIRALLRSPQGFQVLSALMDGANPEWWSDLALAREISGLLGKRKS